MSGYFGDYRNKDFRFYGACGCGGYGGGYDSGCGRNFEFRNCFKRFRRHRGCGCH